MKRVFSMLCVLALMLGMFTLPAYATDQAPGTVAAVCGEKNYSSLQAAMDDYSFGTIVLQNDAQDVTVPLNVHLDTNGHNVAGVTVADGATLYVSDSQTDDYTVADGIYGKITDAEGSVQAAQGYVAITEDGAVSYHKADLTLTSMTLRPAVAGVYYNSAFAADEVVAANVECYGVALSVVAEPTAENLDTLCGYSTIYGFEGGEKSGTLLTGIMTEGNTDFANDRNAAMDIYGRAYIKTAEGYTFGATASRSLKEQIEAINAVFGTLNATQKASILDMYKDYESVMSAWELANITEASDSVLAGDVEITVPVEVVNGEVTETVTVEQDGVSITIPFGTLVDTNELTLTVTKETETDVEAAEGQSLLPLDVHVEGLSEANTVPLIIELGKVMPENLNMGNYAAYHTEDNGANEMTLVANDEEFTAHNQYKYTLDGEVTLHVASFSLFTLRSTDSNAWNGSVDHTWYDSDKTELTIRTADQLWSFSQIVGGMAEGIEQDSFNGKTVKLLADINIGDLDSENGIVFYPIGYYNNQNTYKDLANIADVSSGFYTFRGVFDGNGNTISNFYQNTWEMEGDYNDGYAANSNYYRDGMGLFGKVYGGTVKNLTVRNFSCDAEHGTTGTIAAYADCGATFENISIFGCNPRVYNIGNGGIVGCVGWYAEEAAADKVTFKNITVDQTNKISALWGTYDAACGGILGQYYPTSGQSSAIKNTGVHFENCHVAAEMDVNNDVCGNYQYYWYRYCGMFIGSTRENKTENGYTVANADTVSAENCTYNIGKWNNYYYCELVANSKASYTHDHQMSRLVPVANVEGTTVTSLEGDEFTVPATGRYNYVVVSGDHATENATCYHFVNGAAWDHEKDGGTETVNGETVLKEDKQHIYLPFNQLMTGYGWGVKAYQEFTNINPSKDQLAQSSEKFDVVLENTTISADTTSIPVSQLFAAKEDATVNESTVHVFISPVGENSTVVPTYVCVTNNELDDIAALPISGMGKAKITITDYYFCVPTELVVDLIPSSGKYVLTNDAGKTLGVYSDDWVTVGDTDEWTVTFTGSTATLCDANGVYIAPKSEEENGIINTTEAYSWNVVVNDDGTYSFQGQENNVVLASNSGSDYQFRAYKVATVNGNPNGYPSHFVLKAPCAHTYETAVTEPTCTAAGYTTYTCSICSHSYTEAGEEALGHTYGDDDICDICGAEDPSASVNEPVDVTISFDSTAQRTSYSSTAQVWSNAGVTFTNNKANSTTNVADYCGPVRLYAKSEIVLAAPGNITKVVFCCNNASYATALTDSIGSAATVADKVVTVTLSVASTSFTISLTAQVRMDNIVVTYVPDCSHANQESVEAVEANCTTDGKNAGVVCSDCGAVISGCEKIEALGHNYGEGVETTAPTCTAVGTKTYTCGNCSETKTEELAVIDHNYEDGVCSVCGDEKTTAATQKYVKVTEAPTDWSGTYLIVYEDGSVAFDGSLTTLDAANNNLTVTINNGTIEANDKTNAAAFTISAVDGGYTIQSASGYYIGNTADSNKLNSSTSTKYINTITFNADGTAHIVGSGKSVLRFNSTTGSGNYRFRYYKSSSYSSQKAIALYKLVEVPVA